MSTFKEQVTALVVESLNRRDRPHYGEDVWSSTGMEIEDVQVAWNPDDGHSALRVEVDYRTDLRASGTVEIDPGKYLTVLSRKLLAWGA